MKGNFKTRRHSSAITSACFALRFLSTLSYFRSTALMADRNASSRFNSLAPSSVEHS
jgi:hypothetical protein